MILCVVNFVLLIIYLRLYMYVISFLKKNFVFKVNVKLLGMRYDGGVYLIVKEYIWILLLIKNFIIKFVNLFLKV